MNHEECKKAILPLQDAIAIIGGKWKIPIILSLSEDCKRYKELNLLVTGISSKVLSKELHDLEENRLIEKKCGTTDQRTRQYSLTAHGKSLIPLIDEIFKWGLTHRKIIIEQ